MPYTHPSGVKCMTINEFWHHEAEIENRDVSEVMEDYYSSIAQEEDSACQQILNDKDGALLKLQEYYHPDYIDDLEFIPTEVIEITGAKVNFSMRNSRTSFTVKVRCNDHRVRNLEYSEAVYHGSYMEPPDFDCSCKEIVNL